MQEWFSDIKNTLTDKRFGYESAEIKSKSLLKELSTNIDQYESRWTYNENRIIRNLISLNFALERLTVSDRETFIEINEYALQVARLWESIARLGEKTDKKFAFINSALAYEMAGYQANSMCVSKYIQETFGYDENKIDLELLITFFLQRRFIKLKGLCKKVLRPENVDLNYISVLTKAGLAKAGYAFIAICNFFLTGKSKYYSESLGLFEETSKIFLQLEAQQEFSLIHSVKSLLPLMRSRSTWNILGGFSEESTIFDMYLRLLAKGIGKDAMDSPSISELWPSQINAIQNKILGREASAIVKMPTSAGKTRIAEFAIIYNLIKNKGTKCIYVAPYRALVSEVEESLSMIFSNLGYKITSILGSFETDSFEQYLFSDSDILILTPEKLDLFFRMRKDLFSQVNLIILDEAQIVTDDSRGIKYELLLTRIKFKFPQIKFLLLSAVMPAVTLEQFADWLQINPDRIITSDWRPSVQRYARLNWDKEKATIQFKKSADNPTIHEYVPWILEERDYTFINQRTLRKNVRRFPTRSKKNEIAAELAFKFASLGPVLVFCSQRNYVADVATALERRIDYGIQKNELIPGVFLRKAQTSMSVIEEWLGHSPILNFLKKGIGVHYGTLPDLVKSAIENDFRNRRFPVLVATNTLAQGVNLPIRTVIVHSCWRRSESSPPTRISSLDYWNIAGRAGRAGEETEGTIIHITTSKNDERDFDYYSRELEELTPVTSALYSLLFNLINDKIKYEEFIRVLDPEILALLVEEIDDPEIMNKIMDVTLSSYQIKDKELFS